MKKHLGIVLLQNGRRHGYGASAERVWGSDNYIRFSGMGVFEQSHIYIYIYIYIYYIFIYREREREIEIYLFIVCIRDPLLARGLQAPKNMAANHSITVLLS